MGGWASESRVWLRADTGPSRLFSRRPQAGADAFKRVSEAYAVLSDERQRKHYDMTLPMHWSGRAGARTRNAPPSGWSHPHTRYTGAASSTRDRHFEAQWRGRGPGPSGMHFNEEEWLRGHYPEMFRDEAAERARAEAAQRQGAESVPHWAKMRGNRAQDWYWKHHGRQQHRQQQQARQQQQQQRHQTHAQRASRAASRREQEAAQRAQEAARAARRMNEGGSAAAAGCVLFAFGAYGIYRFVNRRRPESLR